MLSELTQTLAIFGSGQEWLIVLLVILLLFGGAKIPQLMRGVGRGVGELQEGLREAKDKMKKAVDEEPTSSSNA